MKSVPLTPLPDRTAIVELCQQFQQWWDDRWKNHRHKQPCPCDGSQADLKALGYCSYELGFPDDGFRSAAIVWGQIIEKHTNLIWAREGDGEFVLINPKCEDYPELTPYPRFVMYPRIRICQIMGSTVTQFDQ